MSRATIILTCEHAVNRVPRPFINLFSETRPLLATHEAYDIGAISIARRLAAALVAPLYCAQATRLLVDCNRSLANPGLFSRFSKPLPQATRQHLIETFYQPFRQPVIRLLRERLREKQFVYHFSIHSFTPALRGRVRNADIGLLYDPASRQEQETVSILHQTLQETLPGLRIRRNYPYRGTNDGFTRALRRAFGTRRYAGIEIEINQKLLKAPVPADATLVKALVVALRSVRAQS